MHEDRNEASAAGTDRAAEAPREQGRASARGFAGVETWVFDLDNTLYPPDSLVWPKIDARITAWLADHFDLDPVAARALQKHYYERHGTTLKGLMDEHGTDPAAFLEFVHAIDHSTIQPDPALGAAIARLPGRKLVMTNGSVGHARAVTAALGLGDHFEGFSDIVAANYVPKPERAAYDRFLARFDVDPARAAMFEDLAKNLRVPHALGMTTTLVVPRGIDPFREAWETIASAEAFVDHVTDDLTGFLVGVADGLGV